MFISFYAAPVKWKRIAPRLPSVFGKRCLFFIAFFLTGLALAGMTRPTPVESRRYLAIFDVTLSQMVEDYADVAGRPISRLAYAKNAFVRMSKSLPPHSFVAVALMSGYTSEIAVVLPFTSAVDQTALKEALSVVMWWNAWQNGSNIKYMLETFYPTFKFFGKPLNIILFSDGGDGNPVSVEVASTDAKFFFADGVRMLFVGVGKTTALLVPAFNEKGEKIGCLQRPYGSRECFTSSLDEKTLRLSAEAVGGVYIPIEDEENINSWLHKDALATSDGVKIEKSYDWIFGLAALILFAASLVL